MRAKWREENPRMERNRNKNIETNGKKEKWENVCSGASMMTFLKELVCLNDDKKKPASKEIVS